MPKKLLDCPDVVSILEQVRRGIGVVRLRGRLAAVAFGAQCMVIGAEVGRELQEGPGCR